MVMAIKGQLRIRRRQELSGGLDGGLYESSDLLLFFNHFGTFQPTLRKRPANLAKAWYAFFLNTMIVV